MMSYRCVRKSEPAYDRDSIYLALTYDTPMTNNAMSVDDEESTVSPRIKRKYIDPWDLENYSYLHRYNKALSFYRIIYFCNIFKKS